MGHITYRDRSSWYYLDLEDYEYSIRQEMVSDEVSRRRRSRMRKAAERKKRMRMMCVQKFSGLGLIVGTVVAGIIIGNVTFGAITIPVGLLLLFSRDCCLIKRKKTK